MKKKLKKNNICTMKAVNYFSNEVIKNDKGTETSWITNKDGTLSACIKSTCCVDAR